MSVVPPERFARLLRRLERERLVAFVARVWAASGWETTTAGPIVVARSDGETRRLLVLPARRFDRFRSVPAHEGPVDAVVVPRRGGGERALPRGTPEVPVVDADDLRSRLRYAVDRQAADEVCRTFLGVELAADRWEREADDPGSDDGVALRDRVRPVLSETLALAAVLLVLVALIAGPPAAEGLLGTDESPAVGIEYAQATGVDGPTAAAVTAVETGPTNVTATCERGPRAVLELQVLAANEGGFDGLATAWSFMDPEARLDQSTAYRPPRQAPEYRALRRADRFRVIEYRQSGDEAVAIVEAVEDGVPPDRYRFVLERGGDDCWRTTAFEWLSAPDDPGPA